MISLAEAAAAFNLQAFTDTSGGSGFSGQTLPYNDGTRSGATTHRRILETAPGVTVPEVVKDTESSEVFIRSAPSIDYFRTEMIRKKYIIAPTDALYSHNTTLGVLSGTTASSIYGAAHYVKRTALEEQSDFFGGYSLLLPSSLSVSAGDFLWNGANYYRSIEDSYVDSVGITTVDCIKLPAPFQTLSITVKGPYNPVTETSATTTVSASCIVEPREKSFQNVRQDAEDNLPGDKTISTLTACSAGDTVGNYRVISARLDGLIYTLHCRQNV